MLTQSHRTYKKSYKKSQSLRLISYKKKSLVLNDLLYFHSPVQFRLRVGQQGNQSKPHQTALPHHKLIKCKKNSERKKNYHKKKKMWKSKISRIV